MEQFLQTLFDWNLNFLIIQMSSYGYMDPHYKFEMTVRPLKVYNKDSHIHKTVSF